MADGGQVSEAGSRLLDVVDQALDKARLTRRGRFWFRLGRLSSPGGISGHLKYLASAIQDTCAYALDPESNVTPRARHDLTLRIRDSGATLVVRPHTDDVLHVMPGREQDVHDTILGSLHPGDTFVDVGANIGYYTVLAGLRVGPAGTVTAVEPVTSTAAILRANVRANGLLNVTVVEAAAGSESVPSVRLSHDSSLMGRATVTSASEGGQAVPQRTLDDICGGLSHITVLKIDVEGSELGVLRGAERTLQRARLIVVECNEGGGEVDRYLRDRGFSVTALRFANHRLARRTSPHAPSGPS